MTVRFSSPPPYPALQILRKNLQHNLELIKKHAPGAQILIPVKANAYGCGLSQIMPFFIENEIPYLGVANPHEGLLARSYGYRGDILNLGGFYPENIDLFFNHNILPAVTDLWQIDLLQQRAAELNTTLKLHIKWDLGMGRIGLTQHQFAEAVEQFRQTDRLNITGLFTHFPCADDPNTALTLNHLKRFQDLATNFLAALHIPREQVLLHSANSYAMLRFPETHLDMVRPGLLFYGYFQNEADRLRYSKIFPVKPSLRLVARPISLRELKKGDTVSYGSLYVCEEESRRVGVIPLGYADGIPRALSGSKVHFSGHPLLGRVTMDQIIVGDLTTDEIFEVLGENSSSAEFWGDVSCSFAYEIITGLGQRLRRELV